MIAKKEIKKVLVALDGSKRCAQTVKYLTKLEPFRRTKIVLFNVFSGVPESYWDLEREPKSVKSAKYMRAWEAQQKKNMEEFIENARNILLRAGFSRDQLSVNIQNRKKGIARDIIHEARNGYDAVLCRRRGRTLIPGIILGSVSVKLLERLSFIPLLLAGRKDPGSKFLIPLDGSNDAMKAVDFAGTFLGGGDYEVCLLNVIRGENDRVGNVEQLPAPSEFVQRTEKTIGRVFEEARLRLEAKGFDPEKINSKIVTGAHSRAATIVEEGRQGDFGTIIMGRRGLSRPRDFFVGRVTNKVIYLAREKSVWAIT
jgi:nucleotide-binding universal stress UspA family protein